MDDYEEYADEVTDQYEDAQDVQDAQLDSYGTFSTPKEKADIYNWFWKVVRLGKISQSGKEGFSDESLKLSKVGNLNNAEIGEFKVSVRDSLNLANLGNIFNHRKFGDYWQSVAMITAATSMAKKGWFMDLSISQKKVRERAKTTASSEKQKWRMFAKKKKSKEEES